MPLDFTATNTRPALLLRARDRLERVERHDRWGVSAADYCDQAADFLLLAGMFELAHECGNEFGVDVASVVKEIDRELGR